MAFETRELRLPDGTTRLHTDCRRTWRTFDFLVACGLFTPVALAGFAQMTAEERGESFDAVFPAVIAYVCREYLRAFDEPLDAFGPTHRPSGH